MAEPTIVKLLNKIVVGKQITKADQQFLIKAGYLADRNGRIVLTKIARDFIKTYGKQV